MTCSDKEVSLLFQDKQKLHALRTQKQAEETVQPSVMHAIPCYDSRIRPAGMQDIPGAETVPNERVICWLPPGGVHEQHPESSEPEGPNQGLQGMGKSPQAQRPDGMPAQRPASKFGRNGRKQRRERPLAVWMQPQPVQKTICIPGQEPFNLSELAAASPQEQKQIIGERLYPMIQATHPDQAGKITGMLLEIDNTELLTMLVSREALAAKTQEAVSVLRAHSAKEREEINNGERKFGWNGRKQRRRRPLAVSMQRQPVQKTICIPGQEPFNLSELAAASPQEQKQIIGERLYPMIQATHPDQAGKITGMLLEIDNTELLTMLVSREALAAKTLEALSVLRAHSAKEREEINSGERKFGWNGRKQRRRRPLAVSLQRQPVQKTICIPGQEPFNLSELAAASPQEQKQIIGERLYPMIQATHPDQAGKITGMLLEIDNTELLTMLVSREALAAKTQEAVSVLRAHSAKEREEINNGERKFGWNGRKQRRRRPLAVSMQRQPVQKTICIPGQEPFNLSELAAASPQEQKQIIGERLYPMIQATHPDQAGKITGMLLEIDNTELLTMLVSREALTAKTQEAESILRAHSAKERRGEIKNESSHSPK